MRIQITSLSAICPGYVDESRRINDVGKLSNSIHICLATILLQQSQTGVNKAPRTAYAREIQLNVSIEADKNAPRKVDHHGLVLVLSAAVVSMQTKG